MTLNRLPRKLMPKHVAKLLVLFLTLGLSFVASGAEFDRVARRLAEVSAENGKAIARIIADGPENESLDAAYDRYEEAKTPAEREQRFREICGQADLLASVEKPIKNSPAQTEITSIKRGPLYRDPGVKQASNWLADALSRLKNLIFRPNLPEGNIGPTSPSFLGNILVTLVWVIIGLAALALVWLAVTQITWKKRLSRKAREIVEEDEPERSLDEWLDQADLLAASGEFRKAVRALYLACLLKFDEARVARFDRGQTNWEHLSRIQNSPRLPLGIDFRGTTKRFDQIWYGFAPCNLSDVNQFREWYASLKNALRETAA